jgi:hypothetical protein
MSSAPTTARKVVRPAKRSAAKRRPFPYARVAKMWAQGKKIAQIAKAIDRVGKGDDPYRALRIALTRMHKGYRDAQGNIVKLPYRISAKTLKLAIKAGKKATA